MKKIIFLTTILIITRVGFGQVAIHADGTGPDSSAVLDINADDKGFLIPEMTAAQRDNIQNPADGLMVFVTDNMCFYYFRKNKWVKIGTGASGWYKEQNITFTMDSVGIGTSSPQSRLEVNGRIAQTGTGRSVFLGDGAGKENNPADNTGNTGIGFNALTMNTSGKANVGIGSYSLSANVNGNKNTAAGYSALANNSTGEYNTAIGSMSLQQNSTGNHNTSAGAFSLSSITSQDNNTALGDSALYNSTGYNNTALGAKALTGNTSGYCNVAAGYRALWKNENGNYNTAIGSNTLTHNNTGYENTTFGDWSLIYNTAGHQNTAVGNEALMNNKTGNNNTAFGNQAGHQLVSGSNNVFIGNNAGYYETGSNKLYIDNSDTTRPLIGGNFLLNTIAFHGKVGIGTESPNEILEVADTSTSGSHSARMIVSDGHGSARRALLFVSPNADDANHNARIEAYDYGNWKGCNLEINRIGKGKTLIEGDGYISGTLKVGDGNASYNAPQTGMIRWNDYVRVDFEGYNGEEWLSFTKQHNGWGKKVNILPSYACIDEDPDTNKNENFGAAVAVSGYLAVIGIPQKDYNGIQATGLADVYECYNNSWTKFKTLERVGGYYEYDHYGASVDLYGNVAVVGAPLAYNNNQPDIGNVYYYTDINTYQYTGHKLQYSGGANDHFGWSVAIWGDYIAAGAPGYKVGSNDCQGRVMIYNNGNFEAALYASDGQQYDDFGESVDLSGDYLVATGGGKAYIFKRNGSNWSEQQILNPSITINQVTIDGNYIAVGGSDTVIVYNGSGSSWYQQAVITPYDLDEDDYFGTSLKLSGEYLIVGADSKKIKGNLSQGAAYIFRRYGNVWSQKKILTAPDGDTWDSFGNAVDISDKWAVIGALGKDINNVNNVGEVYFFKKY